MITRIKVTYFNVAQKHSYELIRRKGGCFLYIILPRMSDYWQGRFYEFRQKPICIAPYQRESVNTFTRIQNISVRMQIKQVQAGSLASGIF